MDSSIYSNFIVSVNAVIPMFCLMLIGVLIKKQNWLNDGELKRCNGVVFKVFFFFMLFDATYRMKPQDYRPILLIAGVGMILVLWGLSWLFACNITKDPASRGAMIQALYRSNFVIMGLPVVMNIFGAENCGVTAMMVAVIVPMYNVLAIITLEYFRGTRPSFVQMGKALILNPMIMGFIFGGIFNFIGIEMPLFANRLSHQLAMMTSPLALIILGASFSGMGRPNYIHVSICVLGRLLVVPAIFTPLCYYLGWRGIEFVTLLVMFAAPTAVISYAMAQQLDSNDVLAGNSVVYSTALSCFTLFLWIFLWKTLEAF